LSNVFQKKLIFKMHNNSLIIFEFKHEMTMAWKVENGGE